MNLRRITNILGIIFLSFGISFSQVPDRFENPDNQEQQSYDSELVYGVNFNTNGGLIGGLMARYAWQVKKNQSQYHILGIEGVHVTNKKETTVYGDSTGIAYIFGKAGNFFSIRPHYGREFILFPKAEEEGVQISFILAGGPSIGLFVPYYVYAGNNLKTSVVTPKPYSEVMNTQQRIFGSAGFTNGLSSIQTRFGLHSKASVSFEYGSDSVAGLELGALAEVFDSTIAILPASIDNGAFFFSFFISAYIGIK